MSGPHGSTCPADFKPYGVATNSKGYRLFLTWVRSSKRYGDEKDTIQCRFVALDPDGKAHIAGGEVSDEERADILHAVVKVLLEESQV